MERGCIGWEGPVGTRPGNHPLHQPAWALVVTSLACGSAGRGRTELRARPRAPHATPAHGPAPGTRPGPAPHAREISFSGSRPIGHDPPARQCARGPPQAGTRAASRRAWPCQGCAALRWRARKRRLDARSTSEGRLGPSPTPPGRPRLCLRPFLCACLVLPARDPVSCLRSAAPWAGAREGTRRRRERRVAGASMIATVAVMAMGFQPPTRPRARRAHRRWRLELDP